MESRNGREIKIDILEGYIRTPEWFRRGSDIFQSTEEELGRMKKQVEDNQGMQ